MDESVQRNQTARRTQLTSAAQFCWRNAHDSIFFRSVVAARRRRFAEN